MKIKEGFIKTIILFLTLLSTASLANTITVSASSIDFGNQEIFNSGVPVYFSITHASGTQDIVTLSNFTIAGIHASDYSAEPFPSSPIDLLLGQSITLPIIFTPTVTGERTATLSFYCGNCTSTQNFNILFSGSGTEQNVDYDGDGVPTTEEDLDADGEPNNDDTDNDGTPNYLDIDDDNDGVLTLDEDIDGDTFPANDDTDGDTIPNYLDTDDDNDGLSTIDEGVSDIDNDGIANYLDSDSDGDNTDDINDNCPYLSNADQSDIDMDDVGDLCDGDIDGDGINNVSDNCELISNAGQDDLDGDLVGDECDDDADGDGVNNIVDNCPRTANTDQQDDDGDGIGNGCDSIFDDSDGDSIPDGDDNCPSVPNSEQADFDLDGIGDACDNDIDNDGVQNQFDDCGFTPPVSATNPNTGCTLAQSAPCFGPKGGNEAWKNHGKYISALAKEAKIFVDIGLISNTEYNEIISSGAQSNCGKNSCPNN